MNSAPRIPQQFWCHLIANKKISLVYNYLLLISALALLSPVVVAGQTGLPKTDSNSNALTERVSVTAVRVETPPTIDGQLNDQAWRTASVIDEFVQRIPVEGAPATENTTVYVAYDNTNLYFGIYAWHSNPSAIRANRVDRDRAFGDDRISIIFDPFMDQQRGYSFGVNAYGVQSDAILGSGAGFGNRDNAWDALFESAGTLVDDGWTAEIAIPFKSLRYPQRPNGEIHSWGLQIERQIRSKNETVTWSPVSTDVMGFLSQTGVLNGMEGLSTQRNLEILPTLTAMQVGALSDEDQFEIAKAKEAGINLKYGLTSNLTLDFTYNPDFSQIESDRPQIAINQRFPLFFPEQRPFFLEGQEIFRLQTWINPLHTRTIVDPRFGAKVTGKVGRMTLGLLMTNDEAPGNIDDPTDPAYNQSAQILTGRLKYELNGESYVGALVTNREFLDTHSRLVALDGNFRYGRNYATQYKLLFTNHRDASGIVKKGYFIDLMARKSGRHFSWMFATNQLSPDFKTDLGFVRRINFRRHLANVAYRFRPENWIVDWGPTIEYDRYTTFSGVLEEETTSLRLGFDFAQNIGFNASVTHGMERFLDTNFKKTRVSLFGTMGTSRRIFLRGGLRFGDQIRYTENPFLGRSVGLSLAATVRPFSRLQSAISLNASRFVDINTNTNIFNVKIIRARTTYQFTKELLVRNILDYNTLDKTLATSVLVTYRVNAGTVFYVGYDDRYHQRDQVQNDVFVDQAFQLTNRAFFTKLQYLFRF